MKMVWEKIDELKMSEISLDEINILNKTAGMKAEVDGDLEVVKIYKKVI